MDFVTYDNLICCKGSSINDITVFKWKGSMVFDNSTKSLVIKSVTMGEGVQNCPKLRDVIYGRTLTLQMNNHFSD